MGIEGINGMEGFEGFFGIRGWVWFERGVEDGVGVLGGLGVGVVGILGFWVDSKGRGIWGWLERDEELSVFCGSRV